MKNVMVNIPNIGSVLLERSLRAKHISISIKPPSKVRVAVPVGVSFKKAEKVARSKEDWIKKHLLKISNIIDKRQVLDSFNKEEHFS